jgi:hypothetical protein
VRSLLRHTPSAVSRADHQHAGDQGMRHGPNMTWGRYRYHAPFIWLTLSSLSSIVMPPSRSPCSSVSRVRS